jgi:hypothetical protein
MQMKEVQETYVCGTVFEMRGLRNTHKFVQRRTQTASIPRLSSTFVSTDWLTCTEICYQRRVSGSSCSREIKATHSRCSEVRSDHLPLCCRRRFYDVISDERSHSRTAPEEARTQHQRRRGQMCSVTPKVRPHVQRPEERVGVHYLEAVS